MSRFRKQKEDMSGACNGEVNRQMKLEASGIVFRYEQGERQVLNQVSLTVESHERVGLSAPSGFGKTTLCKILAGYEEPEQGRVLLDGIPLKDYGPYCPVQMIWQHPELSVNPRRRMKTVLEEGDRIPERVIQGLGIEKDWENRFPGELSGGELQRFCIARALGERTRFLLADEMTAMLDLITQSQIWNFLLQEVKMREIGLLAVSHSEGLLRQVCTRTEYLQELSGRNSALPG